MFSSPSVYLCPNGRVSFLVLLVVLWLLVVIGEVVSGRSYLVLGLISGLVVV